MTKYYHIMRKLIFLLTAGIIFNTISGQESNKIILLKPDKTKGVSVMQAFDVRASVREWSPQKLSLQELSDLLWAANGINRPEEGKRTAPSAMNAQDIDIYAFMEEGIYFYDAKLHILNPVAAGNYMDLPGKTDAPVNLVLVSDVSRFRAGTDSLKLIWASMDCGIVSQNIALFCAGTGLKTRPRAGFPGLSRIRELLQLKNTQLILLNHPVGYGKE